MSLTLAAINSVAVVASVRRRKWAQAALYGNVGVAMELAQAWQYRIIDAGLGQCSLGADSMWLVRGLLAVQPALAFAVAYDEIGPASPWRSPSRRTTMRALWALYAVFAVGFLASFYLGDGWCNGPATGWCDAWSGVSRGEWGHVAWHTAAGPASTEGAVLHVVLLAVYFSPLLVGYAIGARWWPTYMVVGALVTRATFDRFTWPAVWCFTGALTWAGELGRWLAQRGGASSSGAASSADKLGG